MVITSARLALTLLLAATSLGAQAGAGSNSDVPSTHRPPPGMCRIWIDGVPAGRQPAPTDCATAIRRRPPNARVVFGDEVRTPHGTDATSVRSRVATPPTVEPRTAEPRSVEPRSTDAHPAEPAQPAPAPPRRTTEPRVERPPVRLPPPHEQPKVRKPAR
jgi:hypothetical protein